MSLTLDVYAVSIERLRSVIGSRDQTLIDAIIVTRKDDLESIDDIDDESELKCAEALAELVNGEVSGNGAGYLYGYGFKLLCSHLGTELSPNVSGICGASEWIEQIDEVLEGKAIPLRLADLVFSGSPVKIPMPDDYPSIGQWPADLIASARAAMEHLDRSGIDAETLETLDHMQEWLKQASKVPGAAIVGFLN